MGIETIISLWPEPLQQAIMRYRASVPGMAGPNFCIPAAPADGFSRLDICDQYQQEYVILDNYRTVTFGALEVARDIAKSVSGFTCGSGGRRGVFVWEGSPNPTEEQVKASQQYMESRAEQDLLMRNIVEDARVSFSSTPPIRLQKYHYMAADHLRIEGERWQERYTSREVTVNCPYCQTVIQANSVICANCKNVVDARAYAELKAQIEGIPEPKPRSMEVPETPAEPVKSALTPAKQTVKA